MSTRLDPILMPQHVTVASEGPLEFKPLEGKPSSTGKTRGRPGEHSNRMPVSDQGLTEANPEPLRNFDTTLDESISFLPAQIRTRGISTLVHGGSDIIKRRLHTLIVLLRRILWLPHEAFYTFNKRVLVSLLKRIREDDAAALATFIVLISLIIGTIYLLLNLL